MDTSAPDTCGGGAGASPARAAAVSGDDVDVAGNVANGVDGSAMAAADDDLVHAGVLAMAADDHAPASDSVGVSAMAADDHAPASDSVGVSAMAADDHAPASDSVGVSAMAADDDHSPASDSLGVPASAGSAPSGDGHGTSDSETEAEDKFVGLGGERDGYGEAGAFVCHSCSAAAGVNDLGEGGAGVTPMAVDGDTLEGHSER